MSKMTDLLRKVDYERSLEKMPLMDERNYVYNRKSHKGQLKSKWLIWLFIASVIVIVLVAFNYQSENDTVSLNEIFPDNDSAPVDVEYEFVEDSDPAPSEDQAASMSQQNVPILEEKSVSEVQPKSDITAPKGQDSIVSDVSSVDGKENYDFSTFRFTIQAGSFRDQAKAQQKLDGIMSKGYSANIVARDLGNKGQWYRIYVGQFKTKYEANTFLKKFKRDYKDAFVISP